MSRSRLRRVAEIVPFLYWAMLEAMLKVERRKSSGEEYVQAHHSLGVLDIKGKVPAWLGDRKWSESVRLFESQSENNMIVSEHNPYLGSRCETSEFRNCQVQSTIPRSSNHNKQRS